MHTGTSGVVLGGFGYRGRNSFSLTVTTLAHFGQPVQYKGQNDYSSFAEPLADEFGSSGLTIDQALNSNTVSLATKMALYTYLIDTTQVNGVPRVIARSENSNLLNQDYTATQKGGITEITLGAAQEINRKWMVGGSLGIPILQLDRNSYYRESDASGDTDNDFAYMAYRERYRLNGAGINFRGGLIYRPKEYVRLGLAIHSPNLFLVTERFDAGMAADLERLFHPNPGYDSVSASTVSGGTVPDTRYALQTPARIILSASWVFREVENIGRQKGFLTADIEYTNFKWNRFAPSGEDPEEPASLYQPYNDAIDLLYRGSFQFRLGGELKFRTIMTRAGFAWQGNPYQDRQLKARRMIVSGGLGYRNKGYFIDLTYVHRMDHDVHVPYRVNAPRANTFAALKQTTGTVFLTLGFKI
jgi:hypothetical protein